MVSGDALQALDRSQHDYAVAQAATITEAERRLLAMLRSGLTHSEDRLCLDPIVCAALCDRGLVQRLNCGTEKYPRWEIWMLNSGYRVLRILERGNQCDG